MPLPDGVLKINYGVPIIIIGTKVGASNKNKEN